MNGTARKFALLFVILSAVGWIVYTVGFGIRNYMYLMQLNGTGKPAIEIKYFPYWLYGVATPLVYIVTTTYLICGKPISIFLIMFFQPFLYTSGGIILYLNGLEIYKAWDINDQDQLHKSNYPAIIEFAGASTATVLYWVSLMFWSCFRRKDYYNDTVFT